ncbi:MAG: aspartate aminotransferase family protein, partial [Candidatus Eisenbacteria bacterium]
LVAIDLVTDRGAKTPDPERAAAVIADLERRGVLAIPGGRAGNIVSFYPSRRIAIPQIEHSVAALGDSLRATA